MRISYGKPPAPEANSYLSNASSRSLKITNVTKYGLIQEIYSWK